MDRPDWTSRTSRLLATVVSVVAVSTVHSVAAGPPSYNEDIRPILARCLPCHGPDAEAREAELSLHTHDGATASRRRGAAIVVGDPEASSLIARVSASSDRDRMPPPGRGEPLTATEIETLRAWIEAGAQYQEHWAWTPPESALPEAGSTWARRDLDRFVAERLEHVGLSPAPEADRATLARRASLDLTGLPPTPEAVDAFMADEQPGAFERYVDALLASPAFGERWASIWLDVARYADTKGYEQDGNRTIWPWRDWVIRAYNDDKPFDRFTIEQLAGDLVADASDQEVLATAFHRNTMTNDEGGTRDEEFRVAAVVDRVNTTMEAWLGLTAGCAQCHDHKYDPISQEEYYRVFAIFNTSQDADRNDEAPVLGVLDEAGRSGQAALEAHGAELREQLEKLAETLAGNLAEAPGEQDVAEGQVGRGFIPLMDDVLPPGATPQRTGGPAVIPWRSAVSGDGPKPVSGVRMRESRANANQVVQHFFDNAAPGGAIELQEGDVLVARVWIDPAMVPDELVLQWHSTHGGWNHRAFWGADKVPWGVADGPSKRAMGEIPETGRWLRLEMNPADLGLEPGAVINGVACTQHGGPQGGRLIWDAVGVETDAPGRNAWREDFEAWLASVDSVGGRGLPPHLVEAAKAGVHRSPAQHDVLRRHWLVQVNANGVAASIDLLTGIDSVNTKLAAIESAAHRVPVLREQSPDMKRTTHVLDAGDWRSPGETVEPGVPAFLPPLGAEVTAPNRLDFARWLVDRENPLTARVQVNRAWERFFGRGLVETQEDFGTQGDPPSNQALLDHLAVRFMDLDWSWKALCREIVTSATYRQDSARRASLDLDDPDNQLLARGPRFRLDAEAIRDSALSAAGRLDERMYGPPVFPPQPPGIWQVTYNNSSWKAAEDGNRYRRGLYTFWRRTAPYPAMITFDASSRETCVSRRIRTNTPLQALVTLNDEAFIEAAGGLALRAQTESSGTADAVLGRAFQLAVARAPRPEELAILRNLLDEETARFRSRPEDALALVKAARVETPGNLDPAEFAARIVVANVILNLDEFLVRG
ncbi:MAG: PSD1 and planctomycete cytochrome C domain-containing protein [Phycisphaerales bacterium]|nr:PSD1 and planctomycete cytochrome C domain-containing protein [Phycisphaerales bacterium]